MPVQWEKKMLSGKSYLELLRKKNCEELRFFPSSRDMAQIRLFRWQWKWYFQLHCVRGWWKLHHVTSRHCPLIANIRCESWPLHKTRLQRPWFWALRNEDHRTGALVRPWVQRYAPTEVWPEKNLPHNRCSLAWLRHATTRWSHKKSHLPVPPTSSGDDLATDIAADGRTLVHRDL